MLPESRPAPARRRSWVRRWLLDRLAPKPWAEQPSIMPAVRSVGIVKAGKYEGLHKYLAGRYAGSVVLTFTQIEDLIGSPLVEAARLQSDWWSNEDGTDPQHVQAKAWMKANRSASVNLGARTVLFERFAD